MKIDIAEVRRIAALAHIELTDEEMVRMAGELSVILDYIDRLREVDTTGVGVTAAAIDLPPRDDVAADPLGRADVEKNAPDFVHGYFVVPRILGGEP